MTKKTTKKRAVGRVRDEESGRFTSGTGRPSRSRQLRTKIKDAMKAEGITEQQFLQSMVRKAEAGDTALTKLLVELTWPKARPQMVPFDFGIDESMSIGERATLIEEAATSGRCSIDVALAAMQLLETKARLTEFSDIMKSLREQGPADVRSRTFLQLIKGDPEEAA